MTYVTGASVPDRPVRYDSAPYSTLPFPLSESTVPGQGRMRVGVGGWTYEPWRETFYPPGLPQKRELEFASRQLSTIEINGTFYRTQKPESFAKWRDETPDDFVFSVKAPRYATNRKILAEAGSSIDHFFESGVEQLGDKLGPVLWQFAPTKRFEREDFERFLEILPRETHGRALRHVLDVRHASFMTPAFVDLARRYRVAAACNDSDDYPFFADVTSDFVYARLMRSAATIVTGYPADALDEWAARARLWAAGADPADLPRIMPAVDPSPARDVFLYVISGAKERAPAAARELLSRLAGPPPSAPTATAGDARRKTAAPTRRRRPSAQPPRAK